MDFFSGNCVEEVVLEIDFRRIFNQKKITKEDKKFFFYQNLLNRNCSIQSEKNDFFY